MFTPFAFVKSEVIIIPSRTDIPPYSPYVFYNAINTTYSAGAYANDIVNLGGVSTLNFIPSSSNVSYTSGQHWNFTSSATPITFKINDTSNSFLNTMGNNEHTICYHIRTGTDLTNKDIMGSGVSAGAILSGTYSSGIFRGHAWNGTNQAITDTSTTLSTSTEYFVAQRLTITGASTCRMDVFVSDWDGSSPTKTTGSSADYSDSGTKANILYMGQRPATFSNWNGRIYQIAIYDKPLTDSEVTDVNTYLYNL